MQCCRDLYTPGHYARACKHAVTRGLGHWSLKRPRENQSHTWSSAGKIIASCRQASAMGIRGGGGGVGVWGEGAGGVVREVCDSCLDEWKRLRGGGYTQTADGGVEHLVTHCMLLQLPKLQSSLCMAIRLTPFVYHELDTATINCSVTRKKPTEARNSNRQGREPSGITTKQ